MKYLYRATFTDGTFLRQPEDDESVLMPGKKSSKYDFLEHAKGRELAGFVLEGNGHRYRLDCSSGTFFIDDIEIRPGELLPEGLAWVEGDPAQGVYFRSVTKTFDAELQEISTHVRYCFGAKHEPGVKNFLSVV